MSDRSEYVAALQVERENLSRRPHSPTQKRRLAEVDAEVDQFSEKPKAAPKETAEKPKATPKETAVRKATTKPTTSK